jgi:F-type H+-transporting ATPase subunit epsilon
VSLHVALVVPDRELWSGEADMVIAKTSEGDIGVLTGHSPVFGVLAEGSLVEIQGAEEPVRAAVSGGFLSVADDRVSVLAAQAQLGVEVDTEETKRELDAALAEVGSGAAEEPADAKYARARLRAAGQA